MVAPQLSEGRASALLPADTGRPGLSTNPPIHLPPHRNVQMAPFRDALWKLLFRQQLQACGGRLEGAGRGGQGCLGGCVWGGVGGVPRRERAQKVDITWRPAEAALSAAALQPLMHCTPAHPNLPPHCLPRARASGWSRTSRWCAPSLVGTVWGTVACSKQNDSGFRSRGNRVARVEPAVVSGLAMWQCDLSAAAVCPCWPTQPLLQRAPPRSVCSPTLHPVFAAAGQRVLGSCLQHLFTLPPHPPLTPGHGLLGDRSTLLPPPPTPLQGGVYWAAAYITSIWGPLIALGSTAGLQWGGGGGVRGWTAGVWGQRSCPLDHVRCIAPPLTPLTPLPLPNSEVRCSHCVCVPGTSGRRNPSRADRVRYRSPQPQVRPTSGVGGWAGGMVVGVGRVTI